MADIVDLYRALASDSHLQKDWKANQPPLDRAIESPLIAQTSREVATAALLALKLRFEPAAREYLFVEPDAELTQFGRAAGSGGARLVNLIEGRRPADQEARSAAIHCLRFYRDRSNSNPLVRLSWSAHGLGNLASAPLNEIINSALRPTSGLRAAESVRRLAPLLSSTEQFSDVTLRSVLLEIPGLGPERADAVGVFGFGRGWPITDEYLWRLLARHGLLSSDEVRMTSYRRRHLAFEPRWRLLQAAQLAEPRELAATLYLWADEAERGKAEYAL